MKKQLLWAMVIGIVGQGAMAADVVLPTTVVRPDYAEIESLRPTKEIIVIDKTEIEDKGYTTLNDILQDQASISVGKTGYGDIDIRGQGAEMAARNLQVLLDGVPITVLTTHPFMNDYNYIPVDQIEKIEIIPGGGSVQFGAGATGGIINITTDLRSIRRPQSSIRLQLGSKMKSGTASFGGMINDRIRLKVSTTQEHKDYYFTNTYRDVHYYSLGLGYQLSEQDDIVFRASHLKESGQFVASLQKRKFDAVGKDYVPKAWGKETIGIDADGNPIKVQKSGYLNADRELSQANLTWRHMMHVADEFSVDAFWQNGYFRNNNDYDKKMNIRTNGIRAKYTKAYGLGSVNRLVIGLDAFTQRAHLEYPDFKKDWTTGKYSRLPLKFHYEKGTTAFYVSNLYRTGRWDLTQGVRMDHSAWKFDKVAAKSSGVGNRKTTEWAFDFGAAYHYRDTGSVYARYERGFTHPDGVQAADDDGKYIYPSLADNEHYTMYEAGVRDKIGCSTVKLVGFYSETPDQMRRYYWFNPNGFGRVTKNWIATKRYGAELSLMQRFGKWKLSESYSYLRGRSQDSDALLAFAKEHGDDQLRNYVATGLQAVPRHKVVVGATYSPNDTLDISAHMRYTGKYLNYWVVDEYTDKVMAKSSTVWDMDVRYRESDELVIFAGINNLFDKKYAYYRGEGSGPYSSLLPGDERSFYIGAEYQF